MAFTYTRTHAEGEEHFFDANDLFRNLYYSLDDFCRRTKWGETTCEWEAGKKEWLDDGQIIGPDFAIRKYDRDGANPSIEITKGEISIHIQLRFLPNSTITIGSDKELWGRAVLSNPEALKAIEDIINYFNFPAFKKQPEEPSTGAGPKM